MSRHEAAFPLSEAVAVRVAGRLGMAFFLDVLRISCDGRDLLDGLILLTVGHANTEHLDRDGSAGGLFDRYDHIPDAGLLRPISISALANSLGQPFETVRRRSRALVDEGACIQTAKGLTLPADAFVSDRARGTIFAINQKVRGLQLGLSSLGLLPTVAPADSVLMRPRRVARLAVNYCLRQLEAMTAHIDDPTVGVVLIQVIRTTTEHLDDTYTEFSETEDLVRDDLRRPASAAWLASRVGLPGETVRRHLNRLQAQGWVARATGGYFLTREMLRAPPWPQARRDNVVNLNRLFASLSAG